MIHASVIVPFRNAQRTISKCMEGLLSQRYPADRYEIVMVDNNSSDRSAEIVQTIPRIHLAREQRRGAYAARNKGVSEAQGEILVFTDADCVPSSDWLSQMVGTMDDPQVGIVVGSSLPGRKSFCLSLLNDYEHAKNTYIFNSSRKELYCGWTRNMAIRRSLFQDVGLFAERARGSDTIFTQRCLDRYSCDLVRYSPGARISHLEIQSAAAYFRKVLLYGRSCVKYRRIVNAKPLSTRERWLVYRKTVRTENYSIGRSSILLGLLSLGFLYWVLGSLSGAWPSGRKNKTLSSHLEVLDQP